MYKINWYLPVLLLFAFALPLAAQDSEKKTDEEPKTFKQKASYLLGYDIGQDILRRELDLDQRMLIRGLLDAAKKVKPPMSEAEIAAIMKEFEKKEADKANAKWAAMAKSNLEDGLAFLNKNKLKDGVIQLESGLQYQVIKSAKGDKPKNGDRVRIHVKGQLLDGSPIDDTYKAKMPATVTVGGYIRGIDSALRRMSVGEKWKLFIPGDLGLGVNGLPPVVGPNETLVYEVELLEIVKK